MFGIDDWSTSVGGVPLLGTIINGAKSAYHFGQAGIDYGFGDTENAKDHVTEGSMDAVKAIPFAGTAATVGEYLYDTHAGRPTEEGLFDPEAPKRQQTLFEDVREWMWGEVNPNEHHD